MEGAIVHEAWEHVAIDIMPCWGSLGVGDSLVSVLVVPVLPGVVFEGEKPAAFSSDAG